MNFDATVGTQVEMFPNTNDLANKDPVIVPAGRTGPAQYRSDQLGSIDSHGRCVWPKWGRDAIAGLACGAGSGSVRTGDSLEVGRDGS